MTLRSDERYMQMAVALAGRGLGNVSPNPAVGCVIVRNGAVQGRGWTQPGGRPHAETEALARAGDNARGGTAYVTLEPCAHHGQTAPCAEALARAGLSRVVVGLLDPDPRVNGAGVARLREAGIEVVTGVCAKEAEEVTVPFLMRVTSGRPLVTVKVATTLDGRIATVSGESKWITGSEARVAVHGLRARNDAILVGGQTVIADDPELTCRLPGMGNRSPVRVILGGTKPIPPTSKLIRTARMIPTWLLAGQVSDNHRKLAASGVMLIEVPIGERVDLADALRELGRRGITSLMVEGGGRTIGAFVKRDLVDRLVWFRAPVVIGGDGIPALSGLGVQRLDDAPDFTQVSVIPVGSGVVETYEKVR